MNINFVPSIETTIKGRLLNLIGIITMFLISGGHVMADDQMTQRAKAFVTAHEEKFASLERRANLAWWNANITGKDEDFAAKEEAQNAIDAALADPKAFAEVKTLKEAVDKKQIDDPMLRRCVEVLYRLYLEKQVDPELLRRIVAKSNAVEKTFNTFRAQVNGREITDSEVRRILKESRDSVQRKQVWTASKVVGQRVANDLRELVQLRNEAAKKLNSSQAERQ